MQISRFTIRPPDVQALWAGFDALLVLAFFVVLFNGCTKKGMNMEPTESGQFVTATYQVPVEKQSEFIHLLREAETVMRAEGLITSWRAIRMRSKKDPEFILEILQWADNKAFQRAQNTPAVLKLWGQFEALWKEGGFGVARLPEVNDRFAQYDTIR